MKKVVLAVAACALVGAVFLVQSALPGYRAQRVARLERTIEVAEEKNDWERVLPLALRLATLRPADPHAWFIVAEARARLGNRVEALAALERAAATGLTWSLWVSDAEEFASLRGEPRFAVMLDMMRRNARDGAFEAAEPIDGLETVEGWAEDGYRYRLRFKKGGRPQRLLVWLHPSGGSANDLFEQHSAAFAELGWATLVVTRKESWAGWYMASYRALVERTVPAAAATPGIDPAGPVLVGCSAGGQMLLTAWSEGRTSFAAGLVLDAAFPMEHELPRAPEARQTPFFVLTGHLGEKQRWDEYRPGWVDAGVPISFEYVEGGGHTWLLDPPRFEALKRWLRALTDRP